MQTDSTKRKRNPFAEMMAAFNPARFYGRYSELEKIIQGVSSRNPKSYSIRGNRTIGKTSLLKYLCDQALRAPEYEDLMMHYASDQLYPIYVDLETFVTIDQPLEFLRDRITKAIQQRYPELIREASAKDAMKGLHEMFRSWQEKERRLIVGLDHFDHVFMQMNHDDEAFLSHLCRNHQSIIAATEKDYDELIKKRKTPSPATPLPPVLDGVYIRLLSRAEASRLIVEPCQSAEIKLPDNAVEFLLSIGGRQPYLLTAAAQCFVDLLLAYQEQLALNDTVRQQLHIRIGGEPVFAETFAFFWKQLSPKQHDILFKIAAGQAFDLASAKSVLECLENRSLIYSDLAAGKYHIFSDLFKAFILKMAATTPSAETESPEKIMADMAPLDQRLFKYLMDHADRACTFEELSRNIWEKDFDYQDKEELLKNKKPMEAAIQRIRKLTRGKYIANIRGVGYQYQP